MAAFGSDGNVAARLRDESADWRLFGGYEWLLALRGSPGVEANCRIKARGAGLGYTVVLRA